ncbi:hypothetical protein [Williamsia sp.]|uniref:hypothetical protein n=1 Tax=Williamsia sp. TaxID=1872085 RepID=UPI002F91D14E
MTNSSHHASQFRRRLTQMSSMVRQRDYHDMAKRVSRRAYRATGASSLEFPLLSQDVCDSRTVTWKLPDSRPAPGSKLTIAWIMVPPAGGSGGHTTIFRMIEALEAAGHECIVYLYEKNSTPAAFHQAVIRDHWPRIKAAVVDIEDGLTESDAFVATSWESAHVLGSRGAAVPGERLYFVQDFEPFFYPRGSEYALAEDTYRFGFQCIAIGHMVADLVRPYAQVSALEFSCDTAVYKLMGESDRSGIVVYARPDTPRRGTTLAMLALSEFHRLRPTETIHVFGDIPDSSPFPILAHPRVSPATLAGLYNETFGGLAMSFTNISLVVEEMLACGAVPIVNDSPYARADMPSTSVRWAAPTPSAIAAELVKLVDSPNPREQASAAAASIRTDNWMSAKQRIVELIEAQVYG